jgi:hypothetical protein
MNINKIQIKAKITVIFAAHVKIDRVGGAQYGVFTVFSV